MSKGQETIDNMPNDSGNVRGGNSNIPDKGTSRGHTGKDEHLDGASLDQDATNRLGGFNADSNPREQRMPSKAVKGRC